MHHTEVCKVLSHAVYLLTLPAGAKAGILLLHLPSE